MSFHMESVECKMLRKSVDTYEEVKRCLEMLTIIIDDKEDAVKRVVVTQGLIVNKHLCKYFKVLKCERQWRQQMYPKL